MLLGHHHGHPHIFVSRDGLDDAFEVVVEIAGETLRYEHPDPSEAYGRALLALISRSR